jgi:hypothetical protein
MTAMDDVTGSSASPEREGDSDSAGDSGRSGGRARSRELIYLRNYKLTEALPTVIEFSACMVRFQGLVLPKINPDLLWGVQGTTSIRDADGFATADAQFRKLRIYQVDMAYRIPGLPTQETSISEEAAARLGYLHTSRATTTYKRALREQMNKWLHADKDPEFSTLAGYEFDELILARPMLIHRLMEEDKRLNVVVHMVALNGGVTLRIATVRKKPEFIEKVYTRFHADIKTTI